ncbi:MAG: hypothetical protein ABR915_20275, partial [Thermoguttaceae bacterium]
MVASVLLLAAILPGLSPEDDALRPVLPPTEIVGPAALPPWPSEPLAAAEDPDMPRDARPGAFQK